MHRKVRGHMFRNMSLTQQICAGAYVGITNSPLAEQKNSFLDSLRSQAAYMKQTTFLWYVRYFLYLLNQNEEEPRFWNEKFKKRKNAEVLSQVSLLFHLKHVSSQ